MIRDLGTVPLSGPERTLRLPDGRMITCRQIGPNQNRGGVRAVLALHGTPGSRARFDGFGALADELGLSLVAVDRWGYGGSDAPARPSLAQFGDDMVAVADALQLETFALLGVSGGGPFAAATAARAGSRARALALVAPVGPIAEANGEVALSPFHAFAFRELPRIPLANRLLFAAYRGLITLSARAGLQVLAARAGRADRAILLGSRAGPDLMAAFRLGLTPGVGGAVLDMRLFARAWEIDLGAVRCPAALWLGDEDRNVPASAARNLARAIPGCVFNERPGDGHFWIAGDARPVLSWIARS